MTREWEQAATTGDAARIARLLDAGADVDARDSHGQTALMLAAHHGHGAVVDVLVARGANLDVTGKYGLSALMLAIVAGHQHVARTTAERGANLSLTGTGAPGFADKTARDLAAERAMPALVKALDRLLACQEERRLQRIDAAFREGNMAALRAAVEDPSVIPNGQMPLAIGNCLVYAIYCSPLSFIRELLDTGADPKAQADDGFPPLIAALSASRPHPAARTRTDVVEVLDLLLSRGADPHQRGINDYTALHMAVDVGNAPAVRVLMAHGADPSVRTRMDDYDTPIEMAERLGLVVVADLMRTPPR